MSFLEDLIIYQSSSISNILIFNSKRDVNVESADPKFQSLDTLEIRKYKPTANEY